MTAADGQPNRRRLADLAAQIAELLSGGRAVVLVTSGAIGAGRGRLGWQERKRRLSIPEKQAAAAVGQPLLMQVYEGLFQELGLTVAQVLLTRGDVADRQRYLNARHTLSTLLDHGVVPIINENDTVAVEELKFGDNDTLSALVASLLEADLLVLLTDTEGLYTADPRVDSSARLIHTVERITPELEAAAGGAGTPGATGGMITKLQAARLATAGGIPVVIASSAKERVLLRLLEGEELGTYFVPETGRLQARKRWIAFHLQPVGIVRVDDGAKEALLYRGKSLLPRGVVGVEGEFEHGDPVSVRSLDGQEFARGLVNYSAAELRLIAGHKTSEIEAILGYKGYEEVIHRDNLACFTEAGKGGAYQ